MTEQELVTEIIRHLIDLQKKPTFRNDRSDFFPIPRMLPTGNGDGIIVSKQIMQLIGRVGEQLRAVNPLYASSFNIKDMDEILSKAFGAALATIDLGDDLNKNSLLVLENVKFFLSEDLSAIGSSEHTFGCTLFDGEHLSSFEIGPVRIEHRLDWLKRKSDDGYLQERTVKRIAKIWSGQKCRPVKDNRQRIREENIADSIGSATYVCSVSTRGLAQEVGKEKALLVARLSLAGIALLWETPSKMLEGLNLSVDRSVKRRKTLVFGPNKRILSSSQILHMPHGRLTHTQWQSEFKKSKGYFRVLGEVLNFFLAPVSRASRPKLMSVLAQSLLWFHEGCREDLKIKAVVCFASSLDALAGGSKAAGICRLITAQLGILDTQTVTKDGPTMKSVIHQIYDQGRSRTLHGTSDRIGHDWSVTRVQAEWFARYCLVASMRTAGKRAITDDPKELRDLKNFLTRKPRKEKVSDQPST